LKDFLLFIYEKDQVFFTLVVKSVEKCGSYGGSTWPSADMAHYSCNSLLLPHKL